MFLAAYIGHTHWFTKSYLVAFHFNVPCLHPTDLKMSRKKKLWGWLVQIPTL